MDISDKKLYWGKGESIKGKSIKPKSMAEFKSILENIYLESKQPEKKRRLFMEEREKEILIYRGRIVEATTLNELHQVKALIRNRISLLEDKEIRDYLYQKQPLKELKLLLKYVNAEITAFKSKKKEKPKSTQKQIDPNGQFSVLEWATIFYYSDQHGKNSKLRFVKDRMQQFIDHHELNTTLQNFKSKFYNAQKRINDKNDYPIYKLEKITSFLKSNYPSSIKYINEDIENLKYEQYHS